MILMSKMGIFCEMIKLPFFFQTMCGIETAMREVYYPFWFRSAFLKIPTYTMPLVRHLAPNWLVPVVWKPKIFKEFRENTKL